MSTEGILALADRIEEAKGSPIVIGMSASAALRRLAAVEQELQALKASMGEPVAVIKSTEKYGFPLLEWLSADHSFREPIGSMLYAVAQKGE